MGEGPLKGLKVLEFAGIGPAPFAAMLLADLGAQVLRVDRPGQSYEPSHVVFRGRPSVVLDLKASEDVAVATRLVERADAVLEGFRPGVMERLGLGPEVLLSRNPQLVYGRMTGWGQSGPRAAEPGHDINYLALSGALHAVGPADRPIIPANLVGDFGGGALYLAFGVLSALYEAQRSGQGQVVDCAMVDGVASLMAMLYGHLSTGYWLDRRESNTIDGGSHFYNVYACADEQWLAVGAVEPKFYSNFLAGLGIDNPDDYPQRARALWPPFKAEFARRFRARPRQEWLKIFEGKEACVTPVLSMAEAAREPHNVERATFVTRDGVTQPTAAPRFSTMPERPVGDVAMAGEGAEAALRAWGLEGEVIARALGSRSR